MIYLFPHSGLANRIRAIVSGIYLAEVLDQKITIFWKTDNSLGCDFHELFESNEKFIIKNHNFFAKMLDFGKNKYRDKNLLYKFLSIDFALFDNDFPEYIWSKGSRKLDIGLLPKEFKNIYISTCNEFYFDRRYLEYLKPINSIGIVVNRITSKFSKNTIGIHIRRTDHIAAIDESPLEMFVQAIKLELDTDPECTFFLSTDSQEVETQIMIQFPNKVMTYNKVYNRASVQGIKDAMIDLYALSSTCKVYGSYKSSFSDIAAQIGNIPLKIIKK